MNARRTTLLVAALLGALLIMPASQASAAKVGNPGTFTATVLNGSSIKVGSQTFGFGSGDPITFTGTISSSGAINIPESGAHFPTLSAGGYPVHINVADPITGSINPYTGAISMTLRVWIKIDNVPLGGGCRIASDSSPIVVSPLTTGSSGSVTGEPYDDGNGEAKVVNGTFSVPGSSDCGIAGGTVDDTVGIPSGSGNNNAQFFIDWSPIVTKDVQPSFTATPNSGTAPLTVDLNAGATSAPDGVRTCTPALPVTPNCGYRWDYDNNGTVDEVTNTPTVNDHIYALPGTYQTKLTVFDNEQDSNSTTRTVTVNPPPPDLTINKTHSGNFLANTEESYTLAVSNIGSGATQGTTTVTDTLPAGLSFASGTGSGWSCSAVAQVVTCTRTGLINANSSAPNITLNVNVAGNAASSVTNNVAVSTIAGSSPEVVVNNNSDTDPTTIDKVDMGITKTAVGTFETGTVETYNLALNNAGTVPTTGVTTVTDVLPSGISFVSAGSANGWSCGNAGQTVTCTRPAGIPLGSAGSIQIDVVAGSTAVPAVTNTGSVSTPLDANSANNSSQIITPVIATVDLTIDKSHSSAFRVGSAASYTIAVQNRGARSSAGNTTVHDTLPDGLTPTGASGSGWNCTINGQDVDCTRTASILASENAPLITVDVDVTPAVARPTVTNTATVATAGTGLDADSNTANNSDSDPTTITVTDVTIDKSHTGGFPLGGQGTYTLSVRNDGTAPTVGTVTVTDTLPAELSYVNATGSGWSCGAVGQVVTCTRTISIDAGQTAPPISLQVDVADTDEEETVNSASVSAADDVNAANDSDTDPTPLTAADLELSKSHSGDFRVGTTRAYVIEVENVGSQPTVGTTTVTDTLPAGLSFEAASGSGWTCGAALQVVTCTRTAVISPGAEAPPITVQADVNQGAYPSVTNTATVANTEDRNDANDSDSDPTTITASDLAVEKTHQGGVRAGDEATYLIKVTNVGTADTNSPATVTDTLPAGLTYVGSPSADWDCSNSGQDVTCEHSGSIEAGDVTGTTLELHADVAAGAPSQVTNTATVSTANDPVAGNNSDGDTADVDRIDLGVDKSHTGTFPRGGSGTYTIAVDNDGTVPSEGVTTVTDTLPAGLSYAGASGSGWSCSVSSGTVECTHAGPVAAGGDAAPITLNVDVATNAPAQVTNTATVSGADDVDSSDDSDSDPTDTVGVADVTGSIRSQVPAPNGFFRVGTTGTYNVAVRNIGTGPLTGGVTAMVDLPDGLTFVDAFGTGWNCDPTVEGATCLHAADLPADTRSDITVEVLVAGQAAPTATTDLDVSNAADMSGPNNSDSDTTPVKMLDVSVAMQHVGTFELGAQSSFRINVENLGSASTVAGTRIVDELPAGLTFNSGSGVGWSCTSSGQAVVCLHQDLLAPGSQAEPLTLNVTPQASVAGQQLTNTVSVHSKQDGLAVNNTATDQVTIGPAPPAPLPQVKGKVCKKKKGKKGKKCKKRKK